MPAPNEFNVLVTTLFSEELGKMLSIIREEKKNGAEFSHLILRLPITEETSRSHQDHYGHMCQRQGDGTGRTDGENSQVHMSESKLPTGCSPPKTSTRTSPGSLQCC